MTKPPRSCRARIIRVVFSLILVAPIWCLALGGPIAAPAQAQQKMAPDDSATENSSVEPEEKIVGCTKTTGKKDREQELSDKVLNLDFSDLTHEKLNGFTKIPIDADNFELRLLRGYFLIAVVARYGHARIRDRSQDPAGDAAKMLAHLENANTYLAKALKIARVEGVFYCVYRLDLIFEIVEIAKTAIKSTLNAFDSFLVAITVIKIAKKGVEFITAAIKAKQYGQAYLIGFEKLVERVKERDGQKPDGDL